jgi:hypothetical protein
MYRTSRLSKFMGKSLPDEIAEFPIGKKLSMAGYYNVPTSERFKEICVGVDFTSVIE